MDNMKTALRGLIEEFLSARKQYWFSDRNPTVEYIRNEDLPRILDKVSASEDESDYSRRHAVSLAHLMRKQYGCE